MNCVNDDTIPYDLDQANGKGGYNIDMNCVNDYNIPYDLIHAL